MGDPMILDRPITQGDLDVLEYPIGRPSATCSRPSGRASLRCLAGFAASTRRRGSAFWNMSERTAAAICIAIALIGLVAISSLDSRADGAEALIYVEARQ